MKDYGCEEAYNFSINEGVGLISNKKQFVETAIRLLTQQTSGDGADNHHQHVQSDHDEGDMGDINMGDAHDDLHHDLTGFINDMEEDNGHIGYGNDDDNDDQEDTSPQWHSLEDLTDLYDDLDWLFQHPDEPGDEFDGDEEGRKAFLAKPIYNGARMTVKHFSGRSV